MGRRWRAERNPETGEVQILEVGVDIPDGSSFNPRDLVLGRRDVSFVSESLPPWIDGAPRYDTDPASETHGQPIFHSRNEALEFEQRNNGENPHREVHFDEICPRKPLHVVEKKTPSNTRRRPAR